MQIREPISRTGTRIWETADMQTVEVDLLSRVLNQSCSLITISGLDSVRGFPSSISYNTLISFSGQECEGGGPCGDAEVLVAVDMEIQWD